MSAAKPYTPRFSPVFVLFIILVAAPSLAISGFGILAIADARTVAEARLKQSFRQKLLQVAAEVALEVKKVAGPNDSAALQRARIQQWLPEVSRRHFSPGAAVVELVDEHAPPVLDAAARFRLTLDELMKGRSQTTGEWLGSDVISEVRLPSPLQEHLLRVRMVGDDLLAREARLTATIYTLLLCVFYVVLALGVVLVSVRMYREVHLSRLKTDFVSHVSHELRTPLTSIRMFLETMLMGRVKDEAERQECLTQCARETERLSGVIDRVLDWARIEAGKKTYRKVLVTPQDVVDRALRAFRAQTLGADYQFNVSLEHADVCMLVDVDAVADALLNLLQNAFKYTGADKRIRLEVRQRRGRVRFSVTDNGIGIPRTEQKRIFERFYRAEELLNASTQGSGLGLALARRMVEDHGGKIVVTSRPGVGSSFTVALPVATARQRAEAAAVTPAPAARTG